MIFYGPEASYHYGVSSELGTRYSAAPLLHIEAMKEGGFDKCVDIINDLPAGNSSHLLFTYRGNW